MNSVRNTDVRRDVGVGLTVALVTLVNSFAYASFLASGRIANLLPTILASALVATGVTSVVLTRFHSRASALGGPAGNAAAVVGAALTSVVAHDSSVLSRSGDVTIVLALSALVPGIAMLVFWRLRLARAIRYLPYPVLAGFLAGTGWLLLTGSARIADAPGPLAASVIFVVLLRVAQERWKSPLLIPAGVLCATLIVHLYFTIAHVSLSAARDAQWLYPKFSVTGPAIVTPTALLHANWGAIASAWSAFAWIGIVVILVSMMNTAALETETGADTDVHRDLAAIGFANIAAGVCGGFGSQLLLPNSTLAMKGSAGSRIPGYVVAIASLLAVAVAVATIPYLPKPVFAGLIAFFGLRLLEQHAVGALRTMPRPDAFAVFAMLLTTAIAGLPAALGIGLVLTVLFAVVDAGHQGETTRRVVLRNHRSGKARKREPNCILDRDGNPVDVARLRGQLFFGSANAIYDTLQPKLHQKIAPIALVLDLADVHSIDVSAALILGKVARHARRRGVSLIFSNVQPVFELVLRKNGALAEGESPQATLGDALEVCEALVLARAEHNETRATHAFEARARRAEASRARHAICERRTAIGVPAPV